MVKAIHKKDFEKYLAVANPKNGDEFAFEVNLVRGVRLFDNSYFFKDYSY